MKIAVIANLGKEIHQFSKGGSEIFTYMQVSELAKRKEVSKIYVIAVGKDYFNNEKIELVSVLPEEAKSFIDSQPLLNELSQKRSDFYVQYEANLAAKAFAHLSSLDVDIIQDNSTSAILNSLSGLLKAPIVCTLHTNVTSPSIIIPYSLNLLNHTKHSFISIANHQRKYLTEHAMNLNIVKTIYNGIDINNFNYSENTTQDNGFWIGRISAKHNKGLKEAILASNKTNTKLKVVHTVDDTGYYENEIKPLVSSNIIFEKPTSKEEKNKLYAEARFLIYPIMWEEPFGLIFLEAMASGTPVIAFAKGAVPEIIKDGVTGFIVNSSDEDIRGNFIIKKTGIDGLCEAVEKIYNMSHDEYKQMRKQCRSHVENNFTIEKMVDNYFDVYQNLLKL